MCIIRAYPVNYVGISRDTCELFTASCRRYVENISERMSYHQKSRYCPVCGEPLTEQRLYRSYYAECYIFHCSRHGVIYDELREINCADNSGLFAGIR